MPLAKIASGFLSAQLSSSSSFNAFKGDGFLGILFILTILRSICGFFVELISRTLLILLAKTLLLTLTLLQ
ncbi:secreted protein [Candidatus Magnetoovum chiemensis]|nr:secreted protein [Candidatus Magnetoovum chiemensis]